MKDDKKIDFIGIGAAKSGTTWLARCLEEHPDILFSSQKSRKELSFFNSTSNWQGNGNDLSTFNKGLEWYLNQFPEYQEGKVRGEFTVTYLIDEESPDRIKEAFPDVKLIVVLRNPVDMIYSLYHFGKASAISNSFDSFAKAVDNGRILKFGSYYKLLRKYFKLFPRRSVCVKVFENSKEDPIKFVQEVYRFLGVDNSYVPPSAYVKVNRSFRPRSELVRKFVNYVLSFLRKYSKTFYFWVLDNDVIAKAYAKLNRVENKYASMDLVMRKRLKRHYREDIGNLEKLTGIDLSCWR